MRLIGRERERKKRDRYGMIVERGDRERERGRKGVTENETDKWIEKQMERCTQREKNDERE